MVIEEKPKRKPRPWYRIDGDRVLLNTEAAARFHSVTDRTLRNWVQEGCPQEKPGWYDPAAIMRWRNGDGRSGGSAAGESMAARKLEAETKYREAKAKREQLALEAQQGLYFSKDEVEAAWAGRIVELKAGLLAMARKAAGGFADAELRRNIERVIMDEIYDLLDQYSRTGQYTPKQKKAACSRVAAKGT